MDSNDNVPEFSESRYEFSVAEDAAAETVIGVIKAQDPDSGSFGENTGLLLVNTAHVTLILASDWSILNTGL